MKSFFLTPIFKKRMNEEEVDEEPQQRIVDVRVFVRNTNNNAQAR